LVVAILAQSVSAGEDPLRCSKCDSDNPEGAKFCIDCAAPLANRCPKCGQENLPRAKFCADCATPLIAAATKSKVQPESTPSRVLPEEAVANEADGERKTVTALFADIKDSTELMRDLDPEEARAIVDPVLRLMMEAVHRYDGYRPVDQRRIFALFGAAGYGGSPPLRSQGFLVFRGDVGPPCGNAECACTGVRLTVPERRAALVGPAGA
jgi:class 3 adenylate cyclase